MDRDAALTKLNTYITEGRTNLQNALIGIQDEWQNRRDIIVRPEAIDYNVDDFGIHPIIENDTYDLTYHSTGQLLTRAEIPRQFAERLISMGETELLRENLTTLVPRVSSEGILMRHIGTLTKGIFSSRYKRMDAGPIFESFVKSGIGNGYVPYRGVNTDTVYALSMIDQTVYEPMPNEFLVYGVQITTSDYKPKALELNFMMIRIICSNLSVGLNILRKIHLGARFDQEEFSKGNLIELSDKTHSLDIKTISSGIGDMVRASRKHIELLNGVISSASKKEVDINKAVVDLKKRGVKKDMAEKIKTTYEMDLPVEVLPPGKNMWRLSNTISFLAQSEEGDNKLELEKIAFDIAA